MRVYDYLYRDYEKILEAFEHINSDCYLYSFSLNEYELIKRLKVKWRIGFVIIVIVAGKR